MLNKKDVDIICMEHVLNQKCIQKKDGSLVKKPKALTSINNETSLRYLQSNNHESWNK